MKTSKQRSVVHFGTRLQYSSDMIPPFFREEWAANHAGEDPVSCLFRCQSGLKKTQFRLDGPPLTATLILFSVSASLVVGFKHTVVGAIMLGLCSVSLIWFNFERGLKKYCPIREQEQECDKFFLEIGDLFETFGVPPTAYLGKMSRQEFRAYVEAELKTQAARSSLKSFTALSERHVFEGMHKKALDRGLCHKGWENYFPRPATTAT